MNTRRGFAARRVSGGSEFVQFPCPRYGLIVTILILPIVYVFIVIIDLLFQQFGYRFTILYTGTFSEMQKQPQFKGRVGNRKLNAIVTSHLHGVRNMGMLIN